MFGLGKVFKSAKFESEANVYFREKYGIGVEFVGSFKLSEITDEIYRKLEIQNRLNSRDYIIELEKKFKELGFL